MTARNKMRTASEIIREVGLADSLVESAVVHAAEEPRQFNVDRMAALVSTLVATKAPKSVGSRGVLPGHLFQEVDAEPLLDFISAFAIHPGNVEMQPGPLAEYIRRRDFPKWDVVLVSSSTATPADTRTIGGLAIGLQSRTVTLRRNALQISGNKRRVASRGQEKVGLSVAELEAAEETHRLAREESSQDVGPTIADRFYRRERSRPLLMLHFLRVRTKDADSQINGQVHAAYGISFPKLALGEKEKTVAYTANLVAYNQLFGQEDAEGDEDDDVEQD